ncbi:flagellar biosynthetic protein FliR [Geoalkalibacter ferrihydriticus]|uniref:Flagellar biosynthetic protein FliR n=2 Tax=Geoalkalibacter ferrihydriticus TaxID=392333 RepID=A0A0C2HKG2_9BACT|nr:flagellar biosynthetic protein FliR [Geoalkalibacter ferrihydriticus]KIH77556.1 flagellar biosynthesis protein FliR [Geoalkalibacter ferrihydriticus DSM 17813]SDL67869.1 flagellar biosynthetic protein FliR [Geoalkalibacter ferrihydriticus]
MELLLLPVERFQSFLVCLARVGTLVAVLPVFSGGQVPAQVRVGLAVILSLVVFPRALMHIPEMSFDPLSLALLILSEALIGLLFGFVAQFVFSAVELGGTIISYQMGFAAANVFDPQTQRQISVVPQFQNILAILIFLSLDLHHMFLRVLAESYALLAPGQANLSQGALGYVIQLSSDIFVLGVKLAAPVLAVLILLSVVLGVMARVFPQLNVFFLSFPIKIALSLLIISATMNLTAAILIREFNGLSEHFLNILSLL